MQKIISLLISGNAALWSQKWLLSPSRGMESQ
jgi:hypothetical protein